MKITLTGEQNRVFSLPIQNPVQIKGVAGSGKTTVAVYRARHLALSFNELFRKSKAHIFSFNRNLSKFIEVMSKQPEWIVTSGYIGKHAELQQSQF